MSRVRVNSSPDLLPMSSSSSEDFSLEGVSTNVKLLLKLIQDHQEASHRVNDDRKAQRLAGMMTILDDVKTRLEKSQSAGKKKSRAELRRCHTDLKASPVPVDPHKKNDTTLVDEKDRLRRELSISFAAQKRLGVMCASLGREKEIIARELSRKVQELNGLEELVSDIRAQNEKLSRKVQTCATEHRERNSSADGEAHVNFSALQDRNLVLSEQLVKSLDSCKALKRRAKEAQEENVSLLETMEELRIDVEAGIKCASGLKQRVAAAHTDTEGLVGIEEEIEALQSHLESLHMKVSKHKRKESR